MRFKANPLYVLLFISFLLSLCGLYLTVDSYYKNISILAAENQMEFLMTIPQIVGSFEEPIKLPAYNSNILLESNKNLDGKLYGSYYKALLSVRQAAITINHPGFSAITVETLLDARERR